MVLGTVPGVKNIKKIEKNPCFIQGHILIAGLI